MRVWRLVTLLTALAAAVTLGVISTQQEKQHATALEACSAVEAEDFTAALVSTEEISLHDDFGRSAAECRCIALLATDRGAECESLMESLLVNTSASDWAPSPMLAIHMIQTRRSASRTQDAADLARRASRHHPSNADLFYLELVTRSSLEDEELVLREMETRIDPKNPEATRMRTSLATRHLIRGQAHNALEILGDGPPTGGREAAGRWYDTRGMALANAGDLAGVRANYQQWQHHGGNPSELRARYGLTLSIAGLVDPDLTPIELLREGLEGVNGSSDTQLIEALATRLILTLINADLHQEALTVYDRYVQRFEFSGLAREELMRSATHRQMVLNGGDTRRGTIRFTLPDTFSSESVLLISPPPSEPVDADYTAVPLPASGNVEVVRPLDTAPLRWIYRDPVHSVLASGTANLDPQLAIEVAIAPTQAKPPEPIALSRLPGDEARRVILVVLDCGDWPLIQYLRTRGELPALDAMLSEGYRAVLESDPPLTAAALESIVWPGRIGGASFVGVLHQMGVELAGLSSIGDNPFGALSWILPEQPDLFSAIGSKQYSAANLLFSHGGIRAGRHSEITGPNGARRRLPITKSSRDLSRHERKHWPGLDAAHEERDVVHLRTIAAEFDTAAEIVQGGEVDFLALRIEALDILTHTFFARTVRTGQDDGSRFLYELYRYIDTRLGEIHDLLDEDDIFIVMSDHGIRTSMEHSRYAFFTATGRGIPAARAAGQPSLRGLPAAIADMMGLEVDWPQTGVAPWARSTAHSQKALTTDDAS
jgi:hypothetical protein